MWAGVAGPRIDRQLLPGVFAYRPRMSTLTALYCAKKLIESRWHFAAIADIRKFFPSTPSTAVVTALSHPAYRLSEQMVALGASFASANILRAADHPAVEAEEAPQWERTREGLLQGSITAPLISNAVANVLLDRPLAKVTTGHCHVLRYADDILILARDPLAAEDGLAVLEELVSPTPWKLHPEKTATSAIDLRQTPIRWLGMRVSADGISLPADKRQRLIESVVAAEDEHRRWSAAMNAMVQMSLVSFAELDAILGDTHDLSEESSAALYNAYGKRRRGRNKLLRHGISVLRSIRNLTTS
jgi:hypothetical protein